MILKANNDDEATAMLRALMACGHGIRIAVYGAAFRNSKYIVENLSWDMVEPKIRRDIDEMVLTHNGNTISARPSEKGDRIKTMLGGMPDVCLIMTECMDPELVNALVKADSVANEQRAAFCFH